MISWADTTAIDLGHKSWTYKGLSQTKKILLHFFLTVMKCLG